MSQRFFGEPAIPQPWLPLIADVAQAANFSDLEQRVTLATAHILPGSTVQLVWASNALLPLLAPDQLHLFQSGCLLPGNAGQIGYVPLRFGSELEGWLSCTPGGWSAEQEQALLMLAAVLGPTQRALRSMMSPDEHERQKLHQKLASLRDIRSLPDLLAQVNVVMQETLGPAHGSIVLRYKSSTWMELAYDAVGTKAAARRHYWERHSGLTGVVLQTLEPIITENYDAECILREIKPLYIQSGISSYAWMGAPLIDGDAAFGLITFNTTNPKIRFSPLQQELFLTLAKEVAYPIKQAQLLAAAEQQAHQFQALNQITRSINSTLDPERVPALIIEQAQDLLEAEEGSLLLLDEQTGELVFSYAGGPAGYQLLGQRLPSGAGVAGYVATSGQPAITNNARGDGRFYSAPDGDTGFHTRSMVAVPLRGIDGVRGVIEILNRRDDAPFTDEDCHLLEAVADQAMIALENARRFAQIDQALTRRAQELDRSNERLHKILRLSNALRVERRPEDLLHAIVQAVAESAGFRSAVIALVHRERTPKPYLQRVVAAGPAARDIGRLSRARAPLDRLQALLRPEFRRSSSTYLIDRRYKDYIELWGGIEHVYLPDLATPRAGGWHTHDVLFSLLRNSRGELLGLLCVDDPEDGMLPTPEQVQILEIFANQAAVAIENAQLYSELQHSLNSMMALNGLGLALNTTLHSPHHMYELTAGGMVELSGALWSMVLLWKETPSGKHAFVVEAATGPIPVNQQAIEQLAREAISTRRRLTNTMGADNEAWVAVPLRATQSILGAICVGYADGLPNNADLESLNLFANQAAVAAENWQLFGEVREGRDQLASIMDSTQEGMLLVDGSSQVAVANDALHKLIDVPSWALLPEQNADLSELPLKAMFDLWKETGAYPPIDFELLIHATEQVALGQTQAMRGHLNPLRPGKRALEWSVLRVSQEGQPTQPDATGPHYWPLLLTLRDITTAKEAERLRQDLTNMMIHDLRSPLTSIMTSIDMISRGTVGPATQAQQDILGIASLSAQHLLSMVNLLLDISRLESGQMPLEVAQVSPYDLVYGAIERLTLIAQKSNVQIDLRADPDLPLAYADGELISRVLQNLLDNALKFTPKNGKIIASIELEADSIRFSIRDFGPGIQAADLEKIFAKFGQAAGRRRSGSGLGLTFCKLVVEAQGGQIWVDSVLTEGSVFHFTLPSKREQPS